MSALSALVTNDAAIPMAVAELGKARLAACPYHALRSVICEFRHGILTLRGRLPTFFHKQMAQEVVNGLNGVSQIVNQIEVMALGKC
jgi:osmotically-inducible protein OsmY